MEVYNQFISKNVVLKLAKIKVKTKVGSLPLYSLKTNMYWSLAY